MKRQITNLLYVLALSGVLASCSKDNEDEPVYGEATLKSFGFYAEDNEGILFNDYMATAITPEISILLPDYVDKSALIARFEVTDDDVVKVGQTQQTSGVTVNNYTVPVDFIVSEGTNNTKYTINVGDLPAAVWSRVATTSTSLREFVMKVNPSSNIPYLAYVLSSDVSENQRAGVFKLDAGQLVSVGAETFSEGKAANIHMAFTTEGTPYIAFADYTNINLTTPTATTNRASVMYLNGTAWSYVGAKGVTDVKITYNDIVLKPDNQPILFCMNDAAGALARRELNISEFNGTAWTTSIKMPGRPASQYAYNITARLSNNVIYLAVYNAESSTFSLYKNSAGTWTTIADKYLDQGATKANLRDFDMDVDANGNIYIAYADDQGTTGLYRPKVKKYNAETATWSTIGSIVNVDIDDTREFSLALSPAGIPYLLYRNASLFPEVIFLDNETKQWTTPVVLDPSKANNLYIDFTSNGIGYAAFTNTDTDATLVYKLDIPLAQ